MRKQEQREKRYVPVQVRFDTEGNMRPMVIEFDEAHAYTIDKVTDKCRAACQRVGGVGIRYTCMIQGQETYLWFEENRWFVEAKQYLFIFAIVLLTHVLSIALIPILFVFDYSLLLSSSAYGISGVLNVYKRKKIPLITLVANIFAQLIFCVDVFSSIYCYAKIRKVSKS